MSTNISAAEAAAIASARQAARSSYPDIAGDIIDDIVSIALFDYKRALPQPMRTAPSADIIQRLKAACNGHPNAQIPWPHRLLHDAIAEIERGRRIEDAARSMNLRICGGELSCSEPDLVRLDAALSDNPRSEADQ